MIGSAGIFRIDRLEFGSGRGGVMHPYGRSLAARICLSFTLLASLLGAGVGPADAAVAPRRAPGKPVSSTGNLDIRVGTASQVVKVLAGNGVDRRQVAS